MSAKSFQMAGLNALAGDLSKLDQVATEGRVLELDPSLIVTSLQVRTTFTDIQELADSIRDVGQQTPITVGPMNTDTGKYPLILGERRWRAVQLIPGLKVKCIVDATSRNEAALIKAQFTENEHRNGLLPHEVGVVIQRYKEARLAEGDKLTQSQIAAEWNKPVHYINVHVGLSDLPDCILNLITTNVTRDSELLFSLKSYYKLEPEACEAFISEALQQPDLLTRAAARNKAREAKNRLAGSGEGGEKQGASEAGAATPAHGAAVNEANPSTPAASDAASSASVEDQEGANAGGSGAEQKAEPAGSAAANPAPAVQQQPQDKTRQKATVKEIDANRSVIAVNVVREETVKGLLLVNRVVDGQPGKCVVEVTKQGKAVEIVVDTDCIEILTIAELAAIE